MPASTNRTESITIAKGKQFELAVYDFLKALSPHSTVHFNHKVLDRDTGAVRQADAWIVTPFAEHIPLKILISCKDYKRKLDVTHIESFLSEIRSTSASTGIIYASSGFSDNALKKAAAHGVNCCQLFAGKPTPLPTKLTFHSFVCKPRLAIDIDEASKQKLHERGFRYWHELFKIIVEEEVTLLDAVNRLYIKGEKTILLSLDPKTLLPTNWFGTLQFSDVKDASNCYTLHIKAIWAVFIGKPEYHLFNGSYCFSNNSYRGDMKTPPIDTWEFHPGLDFWEEIHDRSNLPNPRMVAVFRQPDVKATLLKYFEGKQF